MTRAALVTALLVGCGPGNLPGHYWELDFSTDEDSCNASTVGYTDTFEYRLVFGTDDVEIAIGEDIFAEGDVQGCNVTYETITWTETRDAGDIQWVLSGDAQVQREEGSCGISADWQGKETFTAVSSEDPAIRPGCTYTLNVAGTYLREVK